MDKPAPLPFMDNEAPEANNDEMCSPPGLQPENLILFPIIDQKSQLNIESLKPTGNKPSPSFFTPRYVKTKEYESYGPAKPSIFHPTIDEMNDFSLFVKKIEQYCAAHNNCGICKIIPPNEWHPRNGKDYTAEELDNLIIEDPIKETIIEKQDHSGVYDKTNSVFRKTLTGREFRKLATSKTYKAPEKESIEELEKHYWKNITVGEPIYGADTPGTLYDSAVSKFNITKLGTILDLLDENNVFVKGINTPYLYCGMYKTTFAWHAEDMDLYSINYLHLGEPKVWYAIPPEAADAFERLAIQLFPKRSSACKGFLRHKTCMISPAVLDHYKIPYGTMVQYPGEFIITFPCGYHMGFNSGFNVAEAINFANDRWVDYGKNCTACYCINDRVKIDMIPFMIKYRPDEYEAWYKYWYEKRSFIPKNEIAKGITLQRLRKLISGVPDETAISILKSMLRYQKALERKDYYKRLFFVKSNFANEVRHNLNQSKLFPHCAVCQYLVPDLNLLTGDTRNYKNGPSLPRRSHRYTINQMFTKAEKDDGSPEDKPIKDELIQCSSCKVVVHKKCYVEIPTTDGSGFVNYHNSFAGDTWECYRCRDRPYSLIETTVCRFCRMKGGALIPSSSGIFDKNEFSHVICALLDRRTKIVASHDLSYPQSCSLLSNKHIAYESNTLPKYNPVPISFESSYLEYKSTYDGTPKSFECLVCGNQGEGLLTCELCDDATPNHFHATCGRLLSVVYERRNYPAILAPYCNIHGPDLPECFIDDPPVTIGERVRVITDDKESEGVVTSIRSETMITVDFLDDMRSDDVPLEDIVGCECNERLCDKINHVYGSIMLIKWSDIDYTTYYRGKVNTYFYQVQVSQEPTDNDSTVPTLIEVEKCKLIRPSLQLVKPKNKKRKLS